MGGDGESVCGCVPACAWVWGVQFMSDDPTFRSPTQPNHYTGSVPRMCVVAPLFGIALLSFEMQKDYMYVIRLF